MLLAGGGGGALRRGRAEQRKGEKVCRVHVRVPREMAELGRGSPWFERRRIGESGGGARTRRL